MNQEDKLSNTERQLYEAMSEISEDCWCAGWMGGNEYSLWAAMHDGELKYGPSEIDRDELAKVAALSVQTGMWIIWRDDDSLPVEEHGPYAIPLHEWSAIYESKQARATPQAPTPAAAEGQAEAIGHVVACEDYGRTIKWAKAMPNVGTALFAAHLPRQAAVQNEDVARLDWLEQRGNDGGLLLHAGNQDTGGHSGLGLINTGRTLRQAVDSARGVKPLKSAPATTEKEKS